jgi:hypothetical protein
MVERWGMQDLNNMGLEIHKKYIVLTLLDCVREFVVEVRQPSTVNRQQQNFPAKHKPI